MIEVIKSIPPYILERSIGWPKALPINLTITPSPRCNSRCQTCNIWLKREDELTLAEWDRIFQSLGRAPFWFTVSGGEPFMFRDLVPLCQSLYRHCRPGIINIPTNSLLCNLIPAMVEEICRACPDSQVIINLSLDGVAEKHDRIRGVPGNFRRFEENYHALRRLSCANLTVGIHSVLSTFNIADAAELFDYALSLRPDSYITEIAEQRVELGTMGLGITPSVDEYSHAIDRLVALVEGYRFRGISVLTEGFRLEYYKIVKRTLAERRQVIPCFAGSASAQIYANGDVWPCCVRAESIGNLRDAGYDFRRVWFSREADHARADVGSGNCHCPLANASYTSMLMHPPTLARVALRVASSSLLDIGPRAARKRALGRSVGETPPPGIAIDGPGAV